MARSRSGVEVVSRGDRAASVIGVAEALGSGIAVSGTWSCWVGLTFSTEAAVDAVFFVAVEAGEVILGDRGVGDRALDVGVYFAAGEFSPE